jgi:hypothetical protein
VKTAILSLTCGDLSDNVCFRNTGPRSNLCAVESPTMFRFIRFLSLLILTVSFVLLSSSATGQNVATWHNDNYRTGWQQNEATLSPSSVSQSTFGLLWQYTNGTGGPIAGQVYAQPLAIARFLA